MNQDLLDQCKLLSAKLINEVEYEKKEDRLIPTISVDAFRTISRILTLNLDYKTRIDLLVIYNRLLNAEEYKSAGIPAVSKDCSAMLGELASKDKFCCLANDYYL